MAKCLKCFRLSEECLDIIDAQPGSTQTEKLEHLILRCAYEQHTYPVEEDKHESKCANRTL